MKDLPLVVNSASPVFQALADRFDLKSDSMIIAPTAELTLKLIQNNMGIGLCLKDMLGGQDDNIVTLNVNGVDMPSPTLWCIHDENTTDKATIAFIKYVKEFFKKTQKSVDR